MFAKDVVLFGPQGMVSDYSQRLSTVVLGDMIHFSSGRSFIVKSKIAEDKPHAMSFLFENSEGQVVRLAAQRMNFFNLSQLDSPQRDTFFEGLSPLPPEDLFLKYMRDYVLGHKVLKQHGIQVPDILEFDPNFEFIVTNKIAVQFDLAEWTKTVAKMEPAYGQILQALKHFLVSTWMFERIGDFGAGQVAWDGQKWQLLDFNADHQLCSSAQCQEVVAFEEFLKLPQPLGQIAVDAKKVVIEKRRHHFCAATLTSQK